MAGIGVSPAPARAKLLMKAVASSRFRMADESFLDQENSKKNLTKPNVQMVDKPKSSANVKKARKQTAGHCFTPA